jgi:uncharacterized protein YqeY
MGLEEKIMTDLKAAMKAKDKAALRGLRAIKQAFLLAKTDGSGSEITATDEIKMMQKLVKQRNESIKIFREQSRDDLADAEQEEVDVIMNYLPKQMTEDDLRAFVKAKIEALGASSMRDMGKVMGASSKELAGQADGAVLSRIVKELLT